MENEKMKYEKPEVEVIYFNSEDIITASGTPLPWDEATSAFRRVSQSFNLF